MLWLTSRGLVLLAALAPLSACGEKEPEDTAPPVDLQPDETGEACTGGTPPVITEMWFENTGMDRYENDLYPTLTIWVSVEDEDWDLSSYKLSVYYDATIDDAVEASASNGFSNSGTISDDGPCTAARGTVGLQLFLAGGGIEYNTLTEFGAVVMDENGVESEMAVESTYTPTSTGEDGGP